VKNLYTKFFASPEMELYSAIFYPRLVDKKRTAEAALKISEKSELEATWIH